MPDSGVDKGRLAQQLPKQCDFCLGQFWDIVNGKCHSCPDGYSVRILEDVRSAQKCGRSIPNTFAGATRVGPPCGEGRLGDPRKGGECWSCPMS